ncbi:MAG: hypothetical protein GY835_03225, partial [bacterium]|nr:hypothetical protein [bacterium]
MTQTTNEPKISRQRMGQIALGCIALLLILCLLTSLLANAGLAGWALWTHSELVLEQKRVAELESQVQRLNQRLEEGGVELAPGQSNEELMDTVEAQVPLL